MKLHKPNKTELKKLFPNGQCAPCVKGYPECKGNREKAKEWKCTKFFSGFFVGETE